MGASSAQSLGASSAQPLGTPLGRGFTPPQLAAPTQPVYEYGYESVRSEPLPPLPPLPDPLTDPFPAPWRAAAPVPAQAWRRDTRPPVAADHRRPERYRSPNASP